MTWYAMAVCGAGPNRLCARVLPKSHRQIWLWWMAVKYALRLCMGCQLYRQAYENHENCTAGDDDIRWLYAEPSRVALALDVALHVHVPRSQAAITIHLCVAFAACSLVCELRQHMSATKTHNEIGVYYNAIPELVYFARTKSYMTMAGNEKENTRRRGSNGQQQH